ncbi:hypothetical protein Vadar_018473 [Vaccinium darrowii]|uniref:Uncharacterized protein n=1 Tax=Vaccinium darrowii TaxID=229202 RepID=A0ACB7YN54_9ERIC|nr:hypothetical protein Vadar_018473 [Vaccinium darrowii]
MFRLHRHKSSSAKSGERISFVFSNIQALQVPKGWDRLYVSLLSTETGKTVNKSGKAYVRNGTCQWTETFSESIVISQDETPKEFQQYFFKLVVGMGSARSSILGEATINLAGYMSTSASIPVSLPLKKCNHGTTLQIEIQCLTPRIKSRDDKWNHTNSFAEDANSDYDDVENNSEVSDCTFSKSIGSSSSNYLNGTSHPGDLGSRETSSSASGSHYSFDSIEGSLGRDSISPQNSASGIIKHGVGRHDSGSGRHHNQREEFGQISHGIIASPLRNSGLSGNFLESEVITMEELRAEARMWERNARKVMADHELLTTEFSDQSKQLANLEVELSASRRECDGLKQEIEHLKVLLEKSMDKQKAIENFKFQPTDVGDIQKVLEDEIKFQKESNHDLALQLKKTQESNLELVSILQEMEETTENQKEEIEKLKSKFGDSEKMCSFGHEGNGEVNSREQVSAEKMRKASCDSDLEGSTVEHPITDLHAEFEQEDNWSLELQQLRESQKNLESTILYLEKALEGKNHEIVVEQNLRTRTLQDCDAEWKRKFTAKEEELVNLKENLSKAFSERDSESGGDLDFIKEIEALKEKVQELEKDCNELTDENLELLHTLKEGTKNFPENSAHFKSLPYECPAHMSPVVSEIEVSEFKYQMCQFDVEINNEEIPNQGVAAKFENSESRSAIDKFDKFELLPALREQLQLLLFNVEKQQQIPCSTLASKCKNDIKNSNSLKCTELTIQKDLEEAVLDNLVQLNKFFGAKITSCEDDLRSARAVEFQNKLEADNLKDNPICACSQGINCLNKELESTVADLKKELFRKSSEIEKLNVDHLLKDEEIGDSRRRQKDLETHISDLQKIIEQMEGNLEVMQRKSTVTTQCLDRLKNDLTEQSSSMESHISEKKVLERKSLELESSKCQLEHQVSELEEENVLLSQRISGLEAQLRYLTDTKEASRLELHQSESQAKNLKDDIGRLEEQMEALKDAMKQKIEDMQKRWLEAQEECEYLKKANPKLQATAETMIEECSSLQKSNRELRQQKIELREYSTVLEVELKELRTRCSDCSKEIESLEAKFSAIVEEMYSKERLLNSELDAIYQQNKEYEKLVHTEGFSSPGNFILSENKSDILQLDSETNVLALMTELAASKENHETLVTNHEKLLRLLEDVRSNEEKHKGIIHKLESELKSSEQERLQLAEEISSLKTQLQKIPPLQDEVLALKGSLYGTKFENERLQTSLDLLSGDFEEMKTDRLNLLQKISSMQKATSEFENCKRSKVALEEKILRMEGDLTASEALCSQEAELKNELGRIRRVNSQFQWKIKQLEEEKQEWLQKAKALEQELKQNNEVKQEQVRSSSNRFLVDPGSWDTNYHIDMEWKHSEKGEEANFIQLGNDQSEDSEPCMETDQVQQLPEDQGMLRHQRQDNNGQHVNAASSPKIAVGTVSRITYLESELAEALEANNMYKAQLKSFLSGTQVDHSDTHENLEAQNKANNKEEKKHKADLLEAELREIRERYLEMSLKYAEVEAQREQLVMKLKTVNSGKRWSS